MSWDAKHGSSVIIISDKRPAGISNRFYNYESSVTKRKRRLGVRVRVRGDGRWRVVVADVQALAVRCGCGVVRLCPRRVRVRRSVPRSVAGMRRVDDMSTRDWVRLEHVPACRAQTHPPAAVHEVLVVHRRDKRALALPARAEVTCVVRMRGRRVEGRCQRRGGCALG